MTSMAIVEGFDVVRHCQPDQMNRGCRGGANYPSPTAPDAGKPSEYPEEFHSAACTS